MTTSPEPLDTWDDFNPASGRVTPSAGNPVVENQRSQSSETLPDVFVREIKVTEGPCEWCAIWIGPHAHAVKSDGTLGVLVRHLFES